MKNVLAILKTVGLSFVGAVFLFTAREIFKIGGEEYFLTSPADRMVENFVACLVFLILVWVFVWVFKSLDMI